MTVTGQVVALDSRGTAYAAYNAHPDHVRFVEQRWLAEVSEFLEIDYSAR